MNVLEQYLVMRIADTLLKEMEEIQNIELLDSLLFQMLKRMISTRLLID